MKNKDFIEKYFNFKNNKNVLKIGGKKSKKRINLNRSNDTNNSNNSTTYNKTNSEDKWKLDFDKYYIGICKMNKDEQEIIKKNPHCAEFFCTLSNVVNCTECSNFLINDNLFKTNPFFKKGEKKTQSDAWIRTCGALNVTDNFEAFSDGNQIYMPEETSSCCYVI
jgi:hypothetical protein